MYTSARMHYVAICVNSSGRTDRGYFNGPLARYVKLWVAHAPGMPGTSSPPPRVTDPDMHHGTCVTHVPWWMSGSLTSGFLWSRWRRKRSRHSRRMRNPQFYVSGKRPMRSVVTVMGQWPPLDKHNVPMYSCYPCAATANLWARHLRSLMPACMVCETTRKDAI